MATYQMHRVIDTSTGKITLSQYDFFDNYILLDSMDIEFDDVLTPEQRLQLAGAMGKDIEKEEEAIKEEQLRVYRKKEFVKTLLCIDYKAPPEFEGDGELVDFNDDVTF